MERSSKRRRASPWFTFSAMCLLAFITIAAGFLALQDSAGSVVPNPRGQPITHKQEPEGEHEGLFPDVDWDYWLSVNPALVGWVTVPGTAIDYAVVQAPENDPTYYLDHDIYRNWNPSGCPYVDAGCDGFGSPAVYIFGHNMGYTDTMFSDFARFSDAGYASDHSLILLQTPERRIVLVASAADIVDGYEKSKRTEYADLQTLHTWYAERFEAADMRIANDPDMAQLFTFVTCSYNYFASERTLVYSQPQTERNPYDTYTD